MHESGWLLSCIMAGLESFIAISAFTPTLRHPIPDLEQLLEGRYHIDSKTTF
jgi:hypothetical protein